MTVTDDHGAAATATTVVSSGFALSTPIKVSDTTIGIRNYSTLLVDGDGNLDFVWGDSGVLALRRFVPSYGVFSTTSIAASDPSGFWWSYPYTLGLSLTRDFFIHLVWEQDPPSGHVRLVYARSTDGGTNFTTPKVLLSGGRPLMVARGPEELDIAFCGDGGNTFAGFMQSLDGGDSFSTPIPIGVDAFCPSSLVIGQGQSLVIVAAPAGGSLETEFANADILAYRSIDGGKTFSPPINVSHQDGHDKLISSIQAHSYGAGNMIATWLAWTQGFDGTTSYPQESAMFARSTDDGQTWEPPRAMVSAGDLRLGCVKSAIGFGGEAYVTYSLHDLDWTIENFAHSYLFFSGDGGATFKGPLPLQEVPAQTACPWITPRRNRNIVLTWNAPLLNPQVNPDVYFSTGPVAAR